MRDGILEEHGRGPLIKVACAIIEREDKILAARRGPAQSQAGLWEFPGGKLNNGETAPRALVREIKEELDVEIEIVTKIFLSPVVYSYPTINIELIPFISRIISGKPAPREHAEIRWVKPREALKLEWAAADIPVVEEYLSRL